MLRIIHDVDIGHYILFAGRITGSGVSPNAVPAAFWFPDKEIKKGDLVVVYTKEGSFSSKSNPSGTTSFFYYWGLQESLFSRDRHAAVLAQISSWQSFLPLPPGATEE